MAKTIAIANQKVVVGKPTTAVNLAASLARPNYSVLLLDIDPQANATSGVGVDRTSLQRTTYHALVLSQPLDTIKLRTEFGFDVLPSDKHLAGAEIELIDFPNRELLLRRGISPARGFCPFTFAAFTLPAN